jgi:RND family efflux transporter MFP subunit
MQRFARLFSMTSLMFAFATVNADELTSVTVTPEPVAEQRLFDGVVEAVNEATIAAQVSDRITVINFDVNDYVPQGAIVVQFRDKQARAQLDQARAALREARARLDEAEKEYVRIANIYEKKLVAKAALDRAVAARNAAKARLAQAQAGVASAEETLENTRVRAPYSGIVTKRHVELGETPRVGAPIMTGLSLDRLRVTTVVPQSLVPVLQGECCPASVRNPAGEIIKVEKLTVFPKADPVSHGFPVRLELAAGQHGLYPGMYVKVAVTTGEQPRLLVPAQAVVQRSEVVGLYVINADGSVSFRHIRTGRTHTDGRVEVHAGLQAGERVALDPVQAGIALKQVGMEAR